MRQSNNQCKLPPTIKDLAKEYNLPALETLFNQSAEQVDVAMISGLTIKELDLENTDCVIRFSYLSDYRNPTNLNESREGFSLSLRYADSDERITESIHCLDKKMTNRFNYTGGGTAYEGFEHMQFIIDHPPREILGAILNHISLK